MYSFGDHLHRHRWTLLLGFLAIALVAFQGEAQEASISFSSDSGLLPCVYRGVPYLHDDSWAVDECTTCMCDNATVTCVIESCQPAFCAEPIKPEGECCYLCPYNVLAKKVTPEITSTNTIAEGGDNTVSLDVPIKFQDAMDTTGVSGTDLWKLSAWASATPDGRSQRIGYEEDILDAAQKDQYYKKKEKFSFNNLEFSFSDPMAECDDMKYICVRIERGDNPTTTGDLGYTLGGYPDSNAQTGCTGAPECRGIVAKDLEWELEPTETVVPYQQTGVNIDASVFFREDNPTLSGNGLWTMGLYGSRTPDGLGDKYGYVPQTLSWPQQGTTLDEGVPLELMDVETDFEIGSVGCNEFGYVCVEFTGGDNPSPNYFFRKEGATDNSRASNTITKCKEQECLSKAIFTDLEVDLGDQVLFENKNNPLTVDLSGITADDSKNVWGDDLWMVGAYASKSPEGEGPKTGLVEQILDPMEAGTNLNEGEDLPFEQVDFDFDMTGVRCEEPLYLCFDLDKNPKASVNYIFEARPDDSVTTTCVDMSDRCKGATATDIEWEPEIGDAPFGQPSPLTIDADVLFDPDSPDVVGDGLWQLGVFAANSPDGDGPRRHEVTQLLDPFNEALPLEDGGPLEFGKLDVDFPIDDIGCDEFRWLCVEFKKGEAPTPDFKFETETGEDSIISCKEQPCRGVEINNLESTPTDVLTDLVLYEGKAENPITYNSVASTTDETGTIRGVDLWTLSQWGSDRANGNGPQANYQEQVLSGYHAALPVMEAADTLDFIPLVTNFDMTGLKCPQVKYICNEVNKDPESIPDFVFTPQPDESVLRSCFEVPDDACRGIIFDDMDWDMTPIGPVRADEPDDMLLNVDLSTLPESGPADGDGLWRIGVFGSPSPDGEGPRLGYVRQILDRAESSTPADGEGAPLELNNLEAEFDLSQIGCDSEYRFLCLEFSKGLRAAPDFKFEVQGGGDQIISCKEQPCRRPVILTDVETDLLGNGRISEGTPNNRILYDITGVADPSSGKADGRDLWDLTTFGSTYPDGRGPRFNPQEANVFTQYQKDRPASPGENIRYGAVDTNFDMTGRTCDEVRYFCSELRKHEYADPDFEFIAKPTDDVLVDCFELHCEGVLIDNTRLTLNSDDELQDGPNELSFDFKVDSNPAGGDAEGDNLWRLETFTATHDDGTGRRDILDQQTLDPNEASRDMQSGDSMVFRNLEARVNSEDVNCDEDYYLCAEISKQVRARPNFSLEGTREDSMTSCKLIKCAKARKYLFNFFGDGVA
ncbi:uncharacterized protein LOC575485 isoform X2 [Strongylocentrotus purpuratus]|uniref:VWFC domain-containing protein n=1 Tax=Strongylocentrotus purpuratus TaxID=7668 RepID=A0A7M7N182_STRPU|nr:uncharacterized protein LOC575485 isoform X2 [Strongylocentrotus purpuratus]